MKNILFLAFVSIPVLAQRLENPIAPTRTYICHSPKDPATEKLFVRFETFSVPNQKLISRSADQGASPQKKTKIERVDSICIEKPAIRLGTENLEEEKPEEAFSLFFQKPRSEFLVRGQNPIQGKFQENAEEFEDRKSTLPNIFLEDSRFEAVPNNTKTENESLLGKLEIVNWKSFSHVSVDIENGSTATTITPQIGPQTGQQTSDLSLGYSRFDSLNFIKYQVTKKTSVFYNDTLSIEALGVTTPFSSLLFGTAEASRGFGIEHDINPKASIFFIHNVSERMTVDSSGAYSSPYGPDEVFYVGGILRF